MIVLDGARGGMSPRLSKVKVRKCGLPSRITFRTIPWIRIRIIIKKEQYRGKL